MVIHTSIEVGEREKRQREGKKWRRDSVNGLCEECRSVDRACEDDNGGDRPRKKEQRLRRKKTGSRGKRTPISIGGSVHYRIPEAFSAFCIIVSFTAANTSRIFVVSVACVRLYEG